MALPKPYAKKQAKATKRRRLKAQQRIRQQRADARRYIEAIHQALEDLRFPESLVAEIEGRLQAQQQLLGKIVGLMFPTLFGARHPHELTRVRGWDKNVPSKLLNALPKRSWLKRLRRLGLEILLCIWRHTQVVYRLFREFHNRFWRAARCLAVSRMESKYQMASQPCSL